MKKIINYFWFLSGVLIIALSGAWIFQINELAHLSGKVAIAEKTINTITTERFELLSSGTLLRKAPSLDKAVQNFNFKRIEQIKYIQASEFAAFAR